MPVSTCLGISTKPDACTDLKPDSVPRRSRTAFRGEAGHRSDMKPDTFSVAPAGLGAWLANRDSACKGLLCRSDPRGLPQLAYLGGPAISTNATIKTAQSIQYWTCTPKTLNPSTSMCNVVPPVAAEGKTR